MTSSSGSLPNFSRSISWQR